MKSQRRITTTCWDLQFPCYGTAYDMFQNVALCCRQSQLDDKGESIFVFEQSNGVLSPCALHKCF